LIVLRNVSTAFLTNNNDFLLMKRSEKRKIAPGYWAGIGGHLEPHEMNSPQIACLREICEETGIRESDIIDFRLKYIILRRSKNEIRINYIYFGNSKKREVIDTDEGKLYWVAKSELLNREFTDTIRITLTHYLELGDKVNDVLVGVVKCENNKPFMNWSLLQDWEN
jgi:8-oxo-dGTP diphosphatase